MKSLLILSVLSFLSLNSLAASSSLQVPKHLKAKYKLALQMAEMSRCDANLKLGVLDYIDEENGNGDVAFIIIESSIDKKDGQDYGIEYTRAVRFAKKDSEFAKAGETILTACDKLKTQ